MPFCGPHTKPHSVRRLSKHYHMQFEPNLEHGIWEIHHTPCACDKFASRIDKTWVNGLTPLQLLQY